MEVIGLILVIGYIIHMCVSLSNSRGFSFHDPKNIQIKGTTNRTHKNVPPPPSPKVK